MDLFKFKKQMWKNEKYPIYIKEIRLPKGHVAWLVIDSLGYGSATGGIRLGRDVNIEEVKYLANEMTLKFTFYNLPTGGAKAGIYSPSPINSTEREDIFFKLGQDLKPLISSKIYYPGTDLGTYKDDIDHLFKGAGLVAEQDTVNNHDIIDSSYYTAVSVFSALKSIASFRNLELKDTRLGIQGLGKVGLKLLKLASEHGIKLVAGSTQHGALYSTEGLDISRIYDLSNKYGDEFVSYYNDEQKIELNEFFEKDMDIMCPCAGINPINNGNMNKIRTKIIVPGCNVAATEIIEKQLYKRGINYLPGFVCNAGGVLGYTLKRFGIEDSERTDFLSMGIQSKVSNLLEQAKKRVKSSTEAARSIVLKNHEKFTLESQARARMNGKLSFSFRLKNHGASEMIQTLLCKLIERKIIAPNYIRKSLTKKIVFDRLFKN